MKHDSLSKLSGATVSLHWIVAVMMILLLATGMYMESTETFALFPWHKSFGVIVLLFAVLRIGWRLTQGWPAPASDYSAVEKSLSRMIHWILILATVLMPVSGFLMSAMGGFGVEVFGLELVSKNTSPNDPTEIVAINESLAGLAHSIHGLGGNVLLFAVTLHVAGALKHHIVDKDATIRRMLGHRV